jgi:hypothetical protein
MAAWGSAHSTCYFAAMGGTECDVRLVGPMTIAGHKALLYRLDQVDCGSKPGILAVISTRDRIFIILIQSGDEKSADVKRFLGSLTVN